MCKELYWVLTQSCGLFVKYGSPSHLQNHLYAAPRSKIQDTQCWGAAAQPLCTWTGSMSGARSAVWQSRNEVREPSELVALTAEDYILKRALVRLYNKNGGMR